MAVEFKRCSRCTREMPITAFALDRSKRAGVKAWCRDCDNARSREYYVANREKRIAAIREWQQTRRRPRKCRLCGAPATSQRHHLCDSCRVGRRRHTEREREKRRELSRPSAEQRGYGKEHRQLRAQWARVMRDEPVFCARCGLPIEPGEPWDLGHADEDRSRYNGPEHRACNRKTATHKAQRDQGVSRSW
jgi:hypothetical protein